MRISWKYFVYFSPLKIIESLLSCNNRMHNVVAIVFKSRKMIIFHQIVRERFEGIFCIYIWFELKSFENTYVNCAKKIIFSANSSVISGQKHVLVQSIYWLRSTAVCQKEREIGSSSSNFGRLAVTWQIYFHRIIFLRVWPKFLWQFWYQWWIKLYFLLCDYINTDLKTRFYWTSLYNILYWVQSVQPSIIVPINIWWRTWSVQFCSWNWDWPREKWKKDKKVFSDNEQFFNHFQVFRVSGGGSAVAALNVNPKAV